MPDTPEPRLAGRELDAALAELMEPRPEPVSARILRERERRFEWYSTYNANSELGWWKAEIGTDHGHAPGDDDKPAQWRPAYPLEWDEDAVPIREVEASIARRGLQEAYVAALALLVTGNYIDCESVELFLLVTAGPQQRCRAALAAVRGAKG